LSNRTRDLCVGASEADITPPAPVWAIGMGNAFVEPDGTVHEYTGRHEPSRGIHDQLMLQAVYLDDGVGKALLLSADLLYPIAAPEIMAAVADSCGIAPEAVFYSVTHNHNGPVEHPAFIDLLVKEAVECARDAVKQARPATMRRASAAYDRLIYDRSAPWGPVDGRIAVVNVLDRNTDDIICSLWNYACHSCSLSYDFNMITADYPGALRRCAKAALGQRVPIVFLAGCAGNVQCVGVKRFATPRMYLNTLRGGIETVEQLGDHIVAAGLAAPFTPPLPPENSRLSISRFTINLPVVFECGVDEIGRRRDHIDELLAGCNTQVESYWKETLKRVYEEALDEALEIVIQDEPARAVDGALMTVGDLALVMVPLEVAWQLGSEIRQRSPFPATMIATTTLDYAGYLTCSHFYEQERDDWAYEAIGMAPVVGYAYTPLAPKVFVSTIVAALEKIDNDSRSR